MIDALVGRMPQQSREQFDHFFLQLSLIASTTTRLRANIEAGDTEALDEVLQAAENVGILPFVLKMAIAHAGQEVRAKMLDHDNWLADTDSRMAPLLQSQAQAMVSQKAMAQAKAQLGAYRVEANEKSKKVLAGLASAGNAALLSTMFVGWVDRTRRSKREVEIRKEYEEELEESARLYTEFRSKQIGNIKSVINKNYEETIAKILMECFRAMADEVEDRKAIEEAKSRAAELETKLRDNHDNSARNAKQVLGRMNAGNDEGLVAMTFKCWNQFCEDYKKNKELEDAVKAAEQKLDTWKAKQKDGATSVLNRMSAATNTSQMHTFLQAWAEYVRETRDMHAQQEMLGGKASQLNGFAMRNKGSAKQEMMRMTLVQEHTAMYMCLGRWKRETKLERMRRYGKEKNNKRKQQLIGVKGLFKNFASELEQGLKEGTPRVDVTAKHHRSRQQQSLGPA